MTLRSAVLPLNGGVLRIRAGNPSPLTGTGTNSYLIRASSGAVLVDAGPDLPSHIDAVLALLQDTPLEAILITHPHLDHSGAAPSLRARTGAQVYSFGRAARHVGADSEGADLGHDPDVTLRDGAQITLAGQTFSVLHTPGHMHGHLCFGYQDSLFTGDHVMGWATSLVSPPDGDMAAYRASLAKLRRRGYARYYPGHGEAIDAPAQRLEYLIGHRTQREAQILAAMAQGAGDAQTIAAAVYTGLAPALLPAAAQNVLAHFIELAANGRVKCSQIGQTAPSKTTVFSIA